MYGILITAMLTTGSGAPEFGRPHNWFGGSGCTGCTGCTGCYGGCTGCTGCCGGGSGFLGVRDFFSSRFGRESGCCGGCTGCYGGYAAGYATPISSSYSAGCYGFGYGTVPDGMMTAPPIPSFPAAPGLSTPPPPLAGEVITPTNPPQASETTISQLQAEILIQAPADARLLVDDQSFEALTIAPGVRLFRTPELQADRVYYYNLAIEVVRGGKTVKSPSQRAIVRAGQRTNVTIADPGVGGTARIKVRVPAGAQLYVEGTAWPLGAGPTAIVTPALQPGKQYCYAVKVEVERDGRRQTLTRDVAFRAGEEVIVDFDEQRLTKR